MTKMLPFEAIWEEFKFQRLKRCLEGSEDIVIVICGNEGSGKSILALALATIDDGFTGKQIYYLWKNYLKANQDTIRNLAKLMPKEIIDKYNVYNLDDKDINTPDCEPLKEGSCLVYDESATQMFNRAAMSKSSISQVKLFISNRFLRLIHFLCVPKIGSLDKYVRDERVKFFILVVKENLPDTNTAVRTAHVWSRQSYVSMQGTPMWRKMLNEPASLLRICPPDFSCTLPNLTEPKYIKSEVLEEYMAKKILFNLKQTKDMGLENEADEIKEKPKKDFTHLRPLPEEECWMWSERTGRSPTAFKTWCKM